LYVSKDVEYDNLTLAEFAAGFASILRLPHLSVAEREARTDHFANLMYLATQFPWSIVRKLHAAVLFEIECGRLRWGDSMAHLEARLLHSFQFSRRGGQSDAAYEDSSSLDKSTVFFCRGYQSGQCSSSNDHVGYIRNERKWLQHICARCWRKSQTISRHRDGSLDCPLVAGSSSEA